MKRSRKASQAEINTLIAYFNKNASRRKIPMPVLTEFAYESCMRLGEVCKIRWKDLDEKEMTVTIMERKDPNTKELRNDVVPLSNRAFEIIQEQPRTDDRIFPYNSRSASIAWTRACTALSVNDLHFHDLRRTGLTDIMNDGVLNPFEVTIISGHKSLDQLMTYIARTPEEVSKKLRNSKRRSIVEA